jgi:hypothetical protein
MRWPGDTVYIRDKIAILDEFTRKLMDSRHGITAVRTFLVNGIKQHVRKKVKCLGTGENFHREAAASAPMRRKKNMLARSNWFRKAKGESNNSVLFQKGRNGMSEGAKAHLPTSGTVRGGRRPETGLEVQKKKPLCSVHRVQQGRESPDGSQGSGGQTVSYARVQHESGG